MNDKIEKQIYNEAGQSKNAYGYVLGAKAWAERCEYLIEALLTVECCGNCGGCREKAIEAIEKFRGSLK